MDIRTKIEMGHYNATKISAKRPIKPRLESDAVANIMRHARDMELYHALTQEYKTACTKYNKENGRLQALFEADAMAEVGIDHLKNKGEIFGYAYEQGHPAGHGEVLSYLEEIAEIVLNSH